LSICYGYTKIDIVLRNVNAKDYFSVKLIKKKEKKTELKNLLIMNMIEKFENIKVLREFKKNCYDISMKLMKQRGENFDSFVISPFIINQFVKCIEKLIISKNYISFDNDYNNLILLMITWSNNNSTESVKYLKKENYLWIDRTKIYNKITQFHDRNSRYWKCEVCKEIFSSTRKTAIPSECLLSCMKAKLVWFCEICLTWSPAHYKKCDKHDVYLKKQKKFLQNKILKIEEEDLKYNYLLLFFYTKKKDDIIEFVVKDYKVSNLKSRIFKEYEYKYKEKFEDDEYRVNHESGVCDNDSYISERFRDGEICQLKKKKFIIDFF
jgi:hypothetical protein